MLALLYTHIDEAYHLRRLARVAGVGLCAAQREVKRLSEIGILRRTVQGRQVHYQANPSCPIFSELRSLVVKTAGVGDVLRAALAPLAGRIRLAFIYGSIARGNERRGSDVDLFVVGEVTFAEVVSAIDAAQKTIGREINPSVYPTAEFRAKLAAGHHFLSTVQNAVKLFLIGDDDELAGLAQ